MQRLIAALTLAVLFCGMLCIPASADPGDPGPGKNVLVLNSYHPEFVWTDGQSDGIIDTLKRSGLNVTITVEYLDWKNFPDARHLANMATLYRDKYHDRPFDVILTTDDAALTFVLDHRADVFGDVPVVFSGLNNYDLLLPGQRLNVTGNIEEISPELTLSSVFLLFPTTSRIYILYENTETGCGIAERIRHAEPGYRDRAEFIYITNITFDEMAATARTLPADSVIISAFTRDSTGRVMDHDRVMMLLTKEAQVPVFSMYEMAMGHGAIGGAILSGYHEGEVAGEMAVRILSGEPVSAVPVNDCSTSIYVFDQKQLDRFGVPGDRLPKGSVIINRNPDILDEYFLEVVITAMAMIVLIIVVIFLVMNIRSRKKAEADLLQNIDKRIAAEHDLRRSEERYRQLFDSSPVMLWEEDFSEGKKYFAMLRSSGIIDFRTYFESHPEEVKKCAGLVRIIDVNQATLTGMGAKRLEELTRALPQIFTDESLATFREELIRLAEGELQFWGETRHLTLDGRTISVLIQMTIAPGYEESLGRVLFSFLDITERKKMETELRQQFHFLQELLDTIPNPVFFKDTEGRYLGCNRAFEVIAGKTRDGIIGKRVNDLWQKEFSDIYYQSDCELFKNPGVQVYESSLQAANGTLHTVMFTKATFHNPDGSVRGLIGVISDITERKMTEVALQRVTKKLNLLNQITITDIQNAVFSLAGYVELERRLPLDDTLQHYLEKQAQIVKTITDSLRFARNYQDLGLHPPVWQNVGHVFIFGISHLDLSTLQREVRLEGLEVYVDPLLENVFFTLAKNTLLHSGTATRVELFFEEHPEGLIIIYSDNGRGIPADKKEVIFERRLERKTGMSLYLAREILAITALTIRETGIPGCGVRFEIFVPRGSYRFTSPE